MKVLALRGRAGIYVTPVFAWPRAPSIFVKVAGQTVRPLVLETET